MKRGLSFLILLTLVSCGIGAPQGPLNFQVSPDIVPVRAEEVNFKILKERVLPKCIGCHKDWTSEEVVNRFTRENNPDESRLFTTIKSGTMPKKSKPLNGNLLEITRNYIENIQYKRPEEAPLPDDGKPVPFEVVNEKVFKISCLPCHQSRALKDAETLAGSKWIDHQNVEKSKLLTAVVSGKMPKQRNLLTPNQIELIRRYLRNFR